MLDLTTVSPKFVLVDFLAIQLYDWLICGAYIIAFMANFKADLF